MYIERNTGKKRKEGKKKDEGMRPEERKIGTVRGGGGEVEDNVGIEWKKQGRKRVKGRKERRENE